MSIMGKATAPAALRGKISNCNLIYISAYELALANGFKGTLEEWLESHFTTATVTETEDDVTITITDKNGTTTATIEKNAGIRRHEVDLLADKWRYVRDRLYAQEITVPTVKANSSVEFLFNPEQVLILHDKDVAFMATNSLGTITAYAMGTKPTLDYTVEAEIKEVKYV